MVTPEGPGHIGEINHEESPTLPIHVFHQDYDDWYHPDELHYGAASQWPNDASQWRVNIGTYPDGYVGQWMNHHYPYVAMQALTGYGGWAGSPEPSTALHLYDTPANHAQQIVEHFGYAHPHEEYFGVQPFGQESFLHANPHYQPVPEQGRWDYEEGQLPLGDAGGVAWERRPMAKHRAGGPRSKVFGFGSRSRQQATFPRLQSAGVATAPGRHEQPLLASRFGHAPRIAGQWQQWKPGEFGKGFITPMGNVTHWRTDGPDGYPTHMNALALTGYGSPAYMAYDRPEAHNFFEVSPEGYVVPSGLQTPEGYQQIVDSHPQFTDQLPEQTNPLQRSIRQQMQEHPEWDFGEYVKQYPNEAQYWQRTADNYQQDSRSWPDPTEPRAAQPPQPRGCTCPQGNKLECPIHGMHADPQLTEMDHSWSMPESQPVGYFQDGPRTWTQAVSATQDTSTQANLWAGRQTPRGTSTGHRVVQRRAPFQPQGHPQRSRGRQKQTSVRPSVLNSCPFVDSKHQATEVTSDLPNVVQGFGMLPIVQHRGPLHQSGNDLTHRIHSGHKHFTSFFGHSISLPRGFGYEA